MLVTLQKKRLQFVILLCAVFLFFTVLPAFAQSSDPISGGFNVAQNIGEGALGTTDIRDIIVNIVNIALGFLGIVAVIIILYGGWLWMTSAGNPDRVEDAKKTLRNAVIGLGIILASWAIVAFFVNQFIAGGGGGGGVGFTPPRLGNGALGAGIIESVYPAPNAQGIARNTKIFITFKEPMDPASIINNLSGNSGILESAAVSIDNLTDPLNITLPGDVQVTVSGGGRVFTFDPVSLLGSNIESNLYRIQLTDQIEKADGTSAFPSAIGGIGFIWQFTVSTIIDITPPTLVSFNPIPLSTNPRNVLVNMVFSEAISPTTILPATVSINDTTNGGQVTGTLFQGANYKTVEFLPDGQCEGQPLNTCGEPVFCLPANSTFRSLVLAADALVPFSGIEDAAGNSFDGNSNGLEEGPGATDFDLAQPASAQPGAGDNAFWEFKTNDTIDLIPPAVIERIPNSGTTGYPLTDQLSIKMDKHLSLSTLRPDGSYNNGKEYVTLVDPAQQVGYFITGTNGNGCSALCLNQGSSAVFGSTCGNNVLDQGEDCDDGGTRAGDGCSANCLNEGTAVCGDGLVTHHEQCDDGNTIAGDGCSVSCLLEGSLNGSCGLNITGNNCCGNGRVEPGEACDSTSDPGCDANQCLYLGNSDTGTCGNGILQRSLGESCDDGNRTSNDGCSIICTLEGAQCGDGGIDIGEDCDTPGVNGCDNFCRNTGNFLSCGDSNLDDGEDCDLGPMLNESYIFINQTGLAESGTYGVRLGSGLRDNFQNCFLPSAESLQGTYRDCITGPSPFYSYGLGPVGSWPQGAFPSCIL